MSPLRSDVKKISRLRRYRIARRLAGLIIATSLLLGVFMFLLLNNRFKIDKVEIIGENTLDEKIIITAIETILDGQFLGLFPNRNIFIYPKRELQKELRDTFIELAQADIYVDGWGKLVVRIYEREPRFIFCPEQILETEPECLLMDATGLIFKSSSYFTRSLYTLLKISDPPTPFVLGDRPGSQEVFSDIAALLELLRRENITIIRVTLAESGDIILDTRDGWQIRTATDIPPERAARNLLLALNSEYLIGSGASKLSDLDYVDIRFGNKVYYKVKN